MSTSLLLEEGKCALHLGSVCLGNFHLGNVHCLYVASILCKKLKSVEKRTNMFVCIKNFIFSTKLSSVSNNLEQKTYRKTITNSTKLPELQLDLIIGTKICS